MTEEPMGIIMYTADGYMSAQLSKPNRKPFASATASKVRLTSTSRKPPPTSPIPASSRDEEAKTLQHSMFVSLFPYWIGQTQPRVVQIDGDDLYLSTANPIQSGGKEANSHFRWKRGV
jgi:Lipocalin-like domain